MTPVAFKGPVPAGRPRVLFLCTGNSARSQIAEALLRHLSGGRVEAFSAGTRPKPEIHPLARRAVLDLYGIDMAEQRQRPKALDSFVGQAFDAVVTVCDRAAESCPVFPGAAERIHWSLEDPAEAGGTDRGRAHAFSETAKDLEARIRGWLAERNR